MWSTTPVTPGTAAASRGGDAGCRAPADVAGQNGCALVHAYPYLIGVDPQPAAQHLFDFAADGGGDWHGTDAVVLQHGRHLPDRGVGAHGDHLAGHHVVNLPAHDGTFPGCSRSPFSRRIRYHQHH
jgi:hypothetical protein